MNSFSKLEDELMRDRTLTGDAKILYARMRSLSAKSGQCFASAQTLAEMTGVNRSTIFANLKELSSVGLIERLPTSPHRSIAYKVLPYTAKTNSREIPPSENTTTQLENTTVNQPEQLEITTQIDNKNIIDNNNNLLHTHDLEIKEFINEDEFADMSNFSCNDKRQFFCDEDFAEKLRSIFASFFNVPTFETTFKDRLTTYRLFNFLEKHSCKDVNTLNAIIAEHIRNAPETVTRDYLTVKAVRNTANAFVARMAKRQP